MIGKKVLAAGFIIVGFAFAAPSVAQAGNPLFCDDPGEVCIYDGNNWVGFLGARPAGGGIQNVSSSANDHMDSWENNIGNNAAWYHDSGGSGTCRTMSAGAEDDNINFVDSDELSSWKTNAGC